MRSLQTTLFVLLLLVFGTQTLRHVYVKWVEPTGSVLDEFREPVAQDILASESLEELKQRYRQAHAARKAFEAGRNLRDIQLARETERAEYGNEHQLRDAIDRLEQQDRDLFKIRFYWACGLVGVLLGLLTYVRLDAWLGMVGLVGGFVEMAVWTSPLWRTWGRQERFEHLLTTKLVLSLVSMALLVALWLWRQRALRRTASTLP